MPPRRRLAAVPADQTPRAPDLRKAVADAIGKMTWLTDSDQALVVLAKRLAEEIETTIDRAEQADMAWMEARGMEGGTDVYKRLEKLRAMCDVAEVVMKLGPQLQAVLRDLGGTPGTRKALAKEKTAQSKLAKLREAANEA